MAKAKTKARETPPEPSQWDRGADGPANRVLLREEPATDIDPETGRETPNPNKVKRWRRDSWIRVYARKGHLTPQQEAAAEKLRLASEGMRERDPLAAIGEVRAQRGDVMVARIDARRYFRALWDAIPQASRPVVQRVVLDDEAIWDHGRQSKERNLQRLREGLDAIAGR